MDQDHDVPCFSIVMFDSDLPIGQLAVEAQDQQTDDNQ
jgi:hypothetical protein